MDNIALLWASKDGREKTYSYRDLDILSNKVANMLVSLGIKKGDRVFLYLNRSPETFFFILGMLKCGAIYCPLFPSFGADAVKDRFLDCEGSLIITEEELVDNIGDFPRLVLDRDGAFTEKLLAMDSKFVSPEINLEDKAIIHYTSGTTGKPKGAVHCHGAILGHYETSMNVLGITRGAEYWCTADPAWVTGTSYGVLGPLSIGAKILVCDPGYRANQIMDTLKKYEISIWYTAPTLLRMLMRENKVNFKEYSLPHLKKIFSVGEALGPEVFHWAEKNLGLPVFDTWFQTETGSIMIANDGSFAIKPGSMGKPINGITIEILDDNWDVLPPGLKGHLSIRIPWCSMFYNYWKREDKYKDCFQKGWYITGDLAYKDDEGYFYFVSREDDVINTAGHLLSPYEVERILVSHPSVEETAVVGIPDKLMGEAVKAYIVLKDNYDPSSQLQMEYRMLVRNRLSPFASPQVIEFVDSIPKTESGKVIRQA